MKLSLKIVVASLIFSFTSPAFADVTYTVTSIDNLTSISDTEVADLNQDNLEDVVTVSKSGPGITVYLSNGENLIRHNTFATVDGFFKTFRTNSPNDYFYTTSGADPTDLAIADMNSDGHKDIIVSNFGLPSYLSPVTRYGTPGGMAVLLGDGLGNFNILQSYQFDDVDKNPSSIKLLDYDFDGDMDVIVLLQGQGDLQIFSNSGSGLLSEVGIVNMDDNSINSSRNINFEIGNSLVSQGNEIIVAYNREVRIYGIDPLGSVALLATLSSFPTQIDSTISKLANLKITDVDNDQDFDIMFSMQRTDIREADILNSYYPGVIMNNVGFLLNQDDGVFVFAEQDLIPVSGADSLVITKFSRENYLYLLTGLSVGDPQTTEIYLSTGTESDAEILKFSEFQGVLHEGEAAYVSGDEGQDLVFHNSNRNLFLFVQNIQTNTAPTITPFPPQTTTEGQPLSFTVSATDPDNDTLTLSASNLPAGSNFNPATGEFSWTPDFNDEGTYEVTFTATEDTPEALSASTSVTISVINYNRPPELTPIGNQTITEGGTLSFTVSATDPDGDDVTLSAANLPAGSTFDGTTFTWNTDFDDAGNYENIEFTATDNGSPMELDVELITITVGDVNRLPELINPGPQAVLEEDTVSFIVSATDPDNDTMTLSAQNLPTGATFNPATGSFSWTPTLSQAGVYTVTFTATDDGTPAETATTDVVITVGDNPTPVEQAEDLIETVVTIDIPQNVENSYLANLQKVGQFIEEGKITAAINQLNAFINKITQDYNQNILTEAEYEQLLEAAENLIVDLS